MLERYKANGKLLLTAEYFVLHGATALVLPVRLGQSMEVEESESKEDILIEWKAYQRKEEWFSARVKIPELTIVKTSDYRLSNRLINIFHALVSLRHDLFDNRKSLLFKTNLDFSRDWGMGSSSTLIANLAAWAKVDPMVLFNLISNGSGYDIDAANRKKPFFFTRTDKIVTESTILSPEITPHLYFVYAGRKQDSESAITEFLKLPPPVDKHLRRISEITKDISATNDIDLFQEMIREHEAILANHLNRIPVKQVHFADFSGVIKSLGAWGGDFLLFIHSGESYELKEYLQHKGISTFFHFDELIYA